MALTTQGYFHKVLIACVAPFALLLSMDLSHASQCIYQEGTTPCPEDCIEDGGQSLCSEPIVVRKESDHPADEELWQYHNCPTSGGICKVMRQYCCAAGGQPGDGPAFCGDCHDLPSTIWSWGRAYTYDKFAILVADDMLLRSGNTDCSYATHVCSNEVIETTDWGISIPSTDQCYAGQSSKYRNGIVIQEYRKRQYEMIRNPPSCSTSVAPTIWTTRIRDIVCPSGFETKSKPNNDLHCYRELPTDCPVTGNPVSPSSGIKYHAEAVSDFPSAFGGFRLHYNSAGLSRRPSDFSQPLHEHNDAFWSSSFSRRLEVISETGDILARIREDNGLYTYYRADGSEWTSTPLAAQRIQRIPASGELQGWRRLDERGAVEEFDSAGRLILLRNSAGNRLTLSYDGNGRLEQITDETGRSIVVAYISDTETEFHLPDSRIVSTVKDELGRLHALTFPGGFQRLFFYKPVSSTQQFRFLLEEIWEDDALVTSYEYDNDSRVIRSTRFEAEGQEVGTYEYEYPQQLYGVVMTRVTDPSGNVQTMLMESINGLRRLVSTTTPCSSCGGEPVSFTAYTDDGLVDHTYDFRYLKTDFEYDERGLEVVRREGPTGPVANDCPAGSTNYQNTYGFPCGERFCTANSPFFGGLDASFAGSIWRGWYYSCTIDPEPVDVIRTTAKEWHPQLRLPVKEARFDGDATGQAEQISTWAYNDRGQTTASCQIDPEVPGVMSYACGFSNQAPNGVRQTRTRYCETSDSDFGSAACPVEGYTRWTEGPAGYPGDVTTYSYYASDAPDGSYHTGDLWKVTNPLGHVTEFLEYDGAGRPLKVRDPNGVDTVITYHPRGWLLTQTTAGATTSYDYLPNGLVSRITQPDGSYLDFEYDAAQRLTAIENALGERIEYELDAAANRTAERIYDDQSTLSFELQQLYDQLGRLETTLTGTGHETDYVYDAAGNLTDVTDALQNTTTHEYDPLNRLKKTLDALDGETLFAYDARDNLVEVTDPEGLSTHYTYNAFDELVELDSPDTGITTYTYDSAGNRLTQTDARSVTTTYSHDALNRPTAVQYPDSSLDVAYFYDEDDSTTECAGSYPLGRLTRMTDPSGTTVYCYDARGNVTEKTRIVNILESVTVGYEYDPANRLSAVIYPSGRKVTYTRDAAGQVTSLNLSSADGQKQETLVSGIGYLPFGSVAQYTFGNQQVLERTHNLDHQITDVISPALELHFRRDPAGNIDRLGTAPGATSPIEEYAYDDLYRLEAVQDDLGADIEAYVYDLIGNRQSKTTGANTELYDYATTSHHLIEVDGDTRTYDAVGNLISDQAGSRTYTYGDHNRLTAFSDPGVSADYVHNGRGERAAKVVNNGSSTEQVFFVYDEAGRLLSELVQPPMAFFTVIRREYVYLEDIPVAVIDYQSGQATYYLHADHLGTPRAVTDAGGVKRWEWRFQSNPFGEVLPDEDPEKTGKPFTLNFRFPGQYYDAESRLHYNHYRDFEPGVGRYAQSDPIGLDGGINTYAYTQGNPLIATDRFGLQMRSDFYGNDPKPWEQERTPQPECDGRCEKWKVTHSYPESEQADRANTEISLASGGACAIAAFCTALATGGLSTVASASIGLGFSIGCLSGTTNSGPLIYPGDRVEIEYEVCCVPGEDMPDIRNVKTKHIKAGR